MPRAARPNVRNQRLPTFIKDWREHEDLTQDQLAERMESLSGFLISGSQLSRVERGDSPYGQDLLEAVAIALRCEPADLLRRRPGDPSSIQPEPIQIGDLAPDQVALIKGMVEQMRRTG